MTRLLLADLRATGHLWIPALSAMTVCAAVGGGVLIAMWTGALTADQAPVSDAEEGIWAVGSTIAMITAIAASGIIGSICGLCLSSRAREHALWLLTGVRPHRLRRALRLQVLLLALLSGIAALPLAYAAAAAVLWQWSAIGIVPPGQVPILHPLQAPLVLALTVLTALWGAAGVTRRAANVPEMRALRESAGGSHHTSWPTILVALGVLALGLVILGVVFSSQLEGPEDRAAGAFSACLMLLLAILLVPGWTLRPLLHVWTALVPSRSLAWRLARADCRYAATRSLTTIVPFAVAASLLAVLDGTTSATAGTATSIAEIAIVIGPALLVSWVGGVCVISMVRRERARDDALLEAAGASAGTRTRAAALEGLVYAVTALMFGALALAASVVFLCAVTGTSVVVAARAVPWDHAAVVSLLTIGTSVGTVLLAGRRPTAGRAQAPGR